MNPLVLREHRNTRRFRFILARRTLLYQQVNIALPTQPRGFGGSLSPVHLRCGDTRTVSYYALFKGLLLLGEPPDCLCSPTSFFTERPLGGLILRSGLFPF